MPAHLMGVDGPFKGLVLNLDEGEEWVVGRDAKTADFRLEDSTVSRRHVRLTKSPEGILLKNLSRINPSLINGEEQHGKPVLLKEGDRVQIGATTFMYSEGEVSDRGVPAPKKGVKNDDFDDVFGDSEESAASTVEPVLEGVGEEFTGLEMPPEPPKPETTAYDTIFEDTGSDEEGAFHLGHESPLLLKVVAGPNAGAEIGIEKGRSYVIGKDPASCDIVFQDLSVSKNHARLSVDEGGAIVIEDLGSKNGVAVNGTVITGPKEITTQDLVALGTTVFMIIDVQAPQETIYSPIISTKQEEVIESEEPTAEEKLDWRKEPIPTRYLVMGGSAAALFLVMVLSFFSLFKSHGVESPHKESLSKIKEALAKFPDVQFSYNPGSGKLFLVGHVLTGVDYQEMKYQIDQLESITSTEENVVIDEGVWRTMNDVLSTTTFRNVSIHSPKAGKFVAVGFVQNGEEYAVLSEYLTVNFPYLDLLENQVVIEENLNAQLQSLVISKDLGAVGFQVSNGNVVFSGRYSEERTKEYEELLKETNAIKGVASVKSFAVAVTPSMAGIDLTSQYKVSGSALVDGKGFSAIVNGRVYTVGDLVDGMKITEIRPKAVFLEKDGLKYRIDYTL